MLQSQVMELFYYRKIHQAYYSDLEHVFSTVQV